ncbi:MAG: ABC transporter ATP-binding protein [Gammaproteobacteria bacterium]|nr:ABC transporter ATP-binding protein [Gammaproteobacteria bacterium]
MDTIINLDDVSFSYTNIPVVRNINLAVCEGEFLGVIGPNAGGKSTLLKLILGLLQPDAGEITVFGKRPEKGRSRIGYVPQHPAFSRDFPINVRDAVLLGRLGETRWYGGYTQEDKDIAINALKAVEIDNIRNQTIDSLSGGQLQRALIARALASRPDILILDEPTANIDVRAEEDIFGLLKQYNDHMTIIVVSHDIGFISGYVDRVACLNQTMLCHTTSEINGKTIEELYGAPVRMIQHAH